MKLYGGKFVKNRFKNQVDQKVESRDALVWDVLSGQSLARVKIQGSSQLITAHFPENWESTPSWLRPGNAVRISHTGGSRGRVELVGHGALVPSATIGDSNDIPVSYTDVILSGLKLYPVNGMQVAVGTGLVRFDGVTQTIEAMPLTTSIDVRLGSTLTLNTFAQVLNVNAASSTLYRYDIIVIGSDLVFDYIAGTAAAVPEMPATPADHLLCGYILVPPGLTAIDTVNLNSQFVQATPVSLTMIIADDDLAWAQLSTSVTVTVYDQYEHAIVPSGSIKLSILNGNGTLQAPDGATSTSEVEYFPTGSSSVFTYTRNGQDPGDQSPVLIATLTSLGISAGGMIKLRDSSSAANIM